MTTQTLARSAQVAIPPLPLNPRVVGVAAAAATLLATYLSQAMGWRQGALFIVGLAAGGVLYHASFGFGGAWRNMIRDGRGAGLRAQVIMLAVTAIVFIPLLAQGEIFGTSLRGNVSPLSISLVAGAFLFGIGMQLGGACASGTLYTVGGGSSRMVVTLIAFIAGSVLGAWHFDEWERAPNLGSVSLLTELGIGGAMLSSLAIFAGVWGAAAWIEKRRHGSLEPSWRAASPRQWLRGPWPLLAGALGLALVNCATLMLAGRPWGITSGFALWGSKVVAGLGVDVAAWPYWQGSRTASLQLSVLEDITSIMNFGILLGALMAAGLAGKFAPVWRLPWRSLAAAVVGGLLLGYGARLAYGCNIGAFFSGVASFSLHGWLWIACALPGTWVGVRLRPLFGLRN